jgi:hypothetical protein
MLLYDFINNKLNYQFSKDIKISSENRQYDNKIVRIRIKISEIF